MPSHPRRPTAFVIASTNHGTMIVNRNDRNELGHGAYGIGYQLLEHSCHEQEENELVGRLLLMRRHDYGDGVVLLDCGANIGTHTVEWSRLMQGWGNVAAFEAQERVFYALCGNITINNCFNARSIWAAIGERSGEIEVPELDPFTPSSFGSLELRRNGSNEYIGQEADNTRKTKVRMVSIDDLDPTRLDFIKLDVEGMEMECLKGAEKSLRRHRPQMMIERIKSKGDEIPSFLEPLGYRFFHMRMDTICIHESDPSLGRVKIST
jgi:FkbM family methyltransferase